MRFKRLTALKQAGKASSSAWPTRLKCTQAGHGLATRSSNRAVAPTRRPMTESDRTLPCEPKHGVKHDFGAAKCPFPGSKRAKNPKNLVFCMVLSFKSSRSTAFLVGIRRIQTQSPSSSEALMLARIRSTSGEVLGRASEDVPPCRRASKSKKSLPKPLTCMPIPSQDRLLIIEFT